jgi:hypothetical protein
VFQRGFRIADPPAAEIDAALTGWFAATAAPVIGGLHEQQPGTFDRLAELKIAEWDWLRQAVNAATGEGHHG